MRKLVASGLLLGLMCGPGATLGSGSASAQPAEVPAAAPDMAELGRHRAALIAQCPALPALDPARAGALPIHVVRWGTEGPRVLIIHGGVQGRLGGGPDTFVKQQAWASEGFQVELVQRPGFGQSPTRGVDDMDREAVWIADMLGDGANLIGHSWGGADALLAAARHPQAVRSLVLVEPALTAIAEADPTLRDNPAVRAGAIMRARITMSAQTPAEYGEKFAGMLGNASGGSATAPAALGSDPAEATRIGCSLLQGKVAPFAEFNTAIETVAAANIPVLIVTGGWNPGFDAAGDVLARLLHGRHIIVRSPSHFVQLANAADFNAEVGAFMRDADKTRGTSKP